jgi:hypothetical protein
VHEPQPVAASFGKTWDAVVEIFAAKNMQIRTMDRSSGFIGAESVSVPSPREMPGLVKLADCGSDPWYGAPRPTEATYSVLVRGDSSRSTVKVSVRWTRTDTHAHQTPTQVECTTLGVWESDLEGQVKQRAEGQPAR